MPGQSRRWLCGAASPTRGSPSSGGVALPEAGTLSFSSPRSRNAVLLGSLLGWERLSDVLVLSFALLCSEVSDGRSASSSYCLYRVPACSLLAASL